MVLLESLGTGLLGGRGRTRFEVVYTRKRLVIGFFLLPFRRHHPRSLSLTPGGVKTAWMKAVPARLRHGREKPCADALV